MSDIIERASRVEDDRAAWIEREYRNLRAAGFNEASSRALSEGFYEIHVNRHITDKQISVWNEDGTITPLSRS